MTRAGGHPKQVVGLDFLPKSKEHHPVPRHWVPDVVLVCKYRHHSLCTSGQLFKFKFAIYTFLYLHGLGMRYASGYSFIYRASHCVLR